jgi:hypothetical protein
MLKEGKMMADGFHEGDIIMLDPIDALGVIPPDDEEKTKIELTRYLIVGIRANSSGEQEYLAIYKHDGMIFTVAMDKVMVERMMRILDHVDLSEFH